MNKKILTAGFLTLSILLPSQAQAADFTEIYVFGDSLSDTGNVYEALGNTFPPSPPYFNGRFSNGQIWVEYLAQSLNLPIDPNTNFAFGGATTGTDNTLNPEPLPPQPLPGLQQEVFGYLNFLSMNGLTADPDALYTVWAGANDYLPTESTIVTPATDPTMTVMNLETAISALAGAGAKNILVVNLPDLGQLPSTRNTPISGALDNLTQAHNTLLSETLDDLETLPIFSDVEIFTLDVNSLFSDAIDNPAKYNLTNVTDRCLTFTSTGANICSNPNGYLFWDQLHPTTAGHRLIGNLAARTLGIPEPSLVPGVAIISFWGISQVLRRQKQKSSK